MLSRVFSSGYGHRAQGNIERKFHDRAPGNRARGYAIVRVTEALDTPETAPGRRWQAEIKANRLVQHVFRITAFLGSERLKLAGRVTGAAY